jgi:glycosyltransferase involved in cell wall biosynthesis
MPRSIITWSYRAILRGLIHNSLHHPLGLLQGAVALFIRSAPNPVYWFKNFAVFFIAMPIICDADRYGLTHLHANFGSSPGTIAWLGKKILGTGMSVTFHSFDIYSRALAARDPLKKKKLLDADLVAAVHQHGLEELKRLVPRADGNKFQVIRIGVVFRAEKKPARPAEPPLVLAAGNLVRVKGFDILLRAMGVLKRRGVRVRLRILGEGAERPNLESIITEEQIGDRTELPGYYQQSELARHLAEAAVFIMPSRIMRDGRREGLPSVIVEAWLSLTPVVASAVGGMAEVVVDGDTGMVFSSEDPASLADRIVHLMGSPELGRRLAENGHRIAREMFSPKRNVSRLLQAIDEHSIVPG